MVNISTSTATICLLLVCTISLTTGETPHDDATPISVAVYAESLCPDCYNFFYDQLYPTWKQVKDLDMMTLLYVPYGNADETQLANGSYSFDCQHGEAECWGNIVETCIIHYYPDTNTYLDIIDCFEEDFYQTSGADWLKSLSGCESTGVDVDQISACTSGQEGNELEHDMAVLTESVPGLNYVPWITFDGVRNKNAEFDFLTELCAAYQGETPDVCQQKRTV